MYAIPTRFSLVFAISVVLIVYMLLFTRLFAMSAFIKADARTAMQESFEELKQQGYWMVHMRFDHISRESGQVCVHWNYRYRSQRKRTGTTPVTTCHT